MADKKISELNAASAVYDTDDLPLVQSGDTKQVNASILKTYVNDAPTIVGGTINATPIGVGTQAAGSFTTLDASETSTLNGTTIPANKTLVVTTDIGVSVQGYDSDLTAWAGKTAPTGDAVGTSDSQTLTNKTISGSSNTLSNIGNSSLSNSSITVGSTAISLGGTISAINGVTIGQSTAAAGSFTTLNASGASVISVSSASDALRITQAGAGNALVVEDSANPDSTPFVVDANGRVLVGIQTSDATTYTANTAFQISSNTQTNSTASLICWNATQSNSANIQFNKSASGTIGTRGVVASGDLLGTLLFSGDDGTSFIRAASIVAAVDGTPGTNDMPGRLAFSTTADGASSPTERMRIDSAGNVGIGIAPPAAQAFRITKSLTGSTLSYAVNINPTFQSDVTAGGYCFQSVPNTQAAAFTMVNLRHFYAAQGTFGAGSTVTNQYGYVVESSLTGATNNYGFYSNIASGTGRYGFYSAGNADNYFAGAVGIGTTPVSGTQVLARNTSAGASTIGLALQNIGNTANTGVILDLTPSNQNPGIRSAQIEAVNNGSNQISLNFKASNGGAPATVASLGYGGKLQTNMVVGIPANGDNATGITMTSTANFGVFCGSGAPTLSAAKGSLYLRSDGSTTNNRMYVNTDGATTWTAVTTAA